jgi:hypothetical protein
VGETVVLPRCVVCGCGGALVYVAAFPDVDGRWPPEWMCVEDYCWAIGFRVTLGYR